MRMYRKQFRSTYMIGAVKINDGLFMGDEFSARDLEFLDLNKITRIINCSGKQIAHRSNKQMKCLTFNWVETDKQVLFDGEGNTLEQIAELIKESESHGEGVLVHSVKGINRSACAMLAYFMHDYKWSLNKSIEYLSTRRPGLKIQQSFMAQLLNLEQNLKQRREGEVINDWSEAVFANQSEQLVKNTYLNSKTTVTQQTIKRKIFNINLMKKESIKLRWTDHIPGGKLTQYFGVPLRKNFKISTMNFQSPTKIGKKGLACAINYNFQKVSNANEKVKEQNEINTFQEDQQIQSLPKKTPIISILKR